MKTLISVTLLAASLAGCASNGTLQIPTALTPPAIATDIQQIQSVAQGICGWREPLSVIAQIVATFTGGGAAIGTVNQVAQQICATVAVAPHAARRGAQATTVYGVPLRGHFVR